MNWSRLKVVNCCHTELCFFKNCINNSSMKYYRGLHFRRLNHLNCALKTDKLLKISHNCPATSRLLRKNGVYSLTSDYNIKTNFDCGEISKVPVNNQTDLFESYPSRTFSNRICFFAKEKSLNKGSSGHGIQANLSFKSLGCISSPSLFTLGQLSPGTFSQLLKSPSLGSCVPSRHFSTEGFYTALAQSSPVQTAQGLLLDLHQYLPWWAVIPVATLAVRSLVVLPLAVHQAQVVGRLAAVNAEMNKLAPELNKEVEMARRMAGWDRNQAKRVFKAQLRQIYQKKVEGENCHPFKMVLLVFFQMPLWICLSVSLRNITAMAQAGYPSALAMRSEGMLWFPDLTATDPLLIPLLLLAVNLTLTEVHALRNVGKGGLLQKVMLNGSRIVIFVVAAAATYNPSSVAYYWLCSSSFGLFQGLLLMSPRVRRALAIPKMGNESPTPYKDVARNLQAKIAKVKALASK